MPIKVICPLLESQNFLSPSKDLGSTARVVEFVKPFFLSRYQEGNLLNRAHRCIGTTVYVVERYNHGLAHSLRQGALAKDIFTALLNSSTFGNPEADSLIAWAAQKQKEDPQILEKIEMASSFQRSGRQSEISSAVDLAKYKQFELQDSVNFTKAARMTDLFQNPEEIQVFAEAILWSNPGILPDAGDLKYLRRILHAAHTLDLRRIPVWSAARMKADAAEQLFGISTNTASMEQLIEALWDRSGQYLAATGDRDCVLQKKHLSDRFFIQTADPQQMALAIHQIRFPS
jgi:hypothetical protein